MPSGNKFVINCKNDQCFFVCPRCGETRNTSGLEVGQTVHCCSKEKFCYRLKDVKK